MVTSCRAHLDPGGLLPGDLLTTGENANCHFEIILYPNPEEAGEAPGSGTVRSRVLDRPLRTELQRKELTAHILHCFLLLNFSSPFFFLAC